MFFPTLHEAHVSTAPPCLHLWPFGFSPSADHTAVFCRILHGAACGLQHVHDSGKVHRDIKAGNIIVTVEADGSGTGKVADFGLTCGEESNIYPEQLSTV